MRVDEYRALQANAMSEAELQAEVVRIAEQLGWLHFHDQDSRRNQAGLPDLILVRRGRLIFAELKRSKGHVSPAQQKWIEALTVVTQHAPAVVNVHIWRPCDLLSGRITGALR